MDSKIPIYLIPYLNHQDVQIRGEILNLFFEISKGLENSLYINIRNKESNYLKRSEEVNKIYGLIGHINTSNEDKMNKVRFLECANDYFYFNKNINRIYLKQIALCFETPNIISPIFHSLKTQAELIQNKQTIIKIFTNLVQGPVQVLNNLRNISFDVFSSIFKLLVNKYGNEYKQNKVLKPLVLTLFDKIKRDSRSDVIEIMEITPGLRYFLLSIIFLLLINFLYLLNLIFLKFQ